jgi:hypothetical protein
MSLKLAVFIEAGLPKAVIRRCRKQIENGQWSFNLKAGPAWPLDRFRVQELAGSFWLELSF